MKPPPRRGLGLVALCEIQLFSARLCGYLLTNVVPLLAFAVPTWTF